MSTDSPEQRAVQTLLTGETPQFAANPVQDASVDRNLLVITVPGLHPDGRGLALPGGGPRSLLALRGRLGDERAHHRCPHPRRPRPGPGSPAPPPGLLHHSDRGSQYASGAYQRVLAQHAIVCSMSRRGDCWDNAVAESFFATLKVELVHDAVLATRAAARTELFDYLELFYNGQRRHSALGYLSPRAFEQRHEQDAVVT